jgi:glycosyltransferase involved in cell wall biosynthesis
MAFSRPLVSVLLPVYNAGNYLDAAVRSILDQSYQELELLAIDDGSTDGSGERLQDHARSDSRMRVVSRENRGLVHTLQELIELAQGDLYARMDADDFSLPQRIEHQVRFFEQQPDVVCVGGGIIIIDEQDRELHHPPPVLGNAHVQRSALEGRMPICHPAAMFRASAVQQVGGYQPHAYPSEDLDLWLRLGEVGKLDNVPQTVLRYRVHSSSVSVQQCELQVAKMREACEAAWKRRGISNGVFRGARATAAAPESQGTPPAVASALETKPQGIGFSANPGSPAVAPQQPAVHNPTAQSLIMASQPQD